MNIVEALRRTQPGAARLDLRRCGGCRQKMLKAAKAASGPKLEAGKSTPSQTPGSGAHA